MLSPEDVDPEIVANCLDAMENTAPTNYQATDLQDIVRIVLASASERLGRDLEHMRGKYNGAHGMAKELGQQLKAAEQALALLHLGEQPYMDEAVVATPAQMIWRWNRTTPERRLEVATVIRDGSDQLDRYERALRRIADHCDSRRGGGNCTSDCHSEVARVALTASAPTRA